MDRYSSAFPEVSRRAWLSEPEPDRGAADSRPWLERRLAAQASRLTRETCARKLAEDDPGLQPYVQRLWNCIEYHGARLGESSPIAFESLIERIESGQLGYDTRGANVLHEVTLAQALELGEQRAAELFDSQYMPAARAAANRLGGARAVEAVENFAAELLLPRGDCPPKIANYQGRTPLVSWLRSVVVNYWIGQTRKPRASNVEMLPELPIVEDAGQAVDGYPCEQLLKPLLRESLLAVEAEDRVLLKMLILDQTPQHELARALGVNSGTLTRRRQRATASVLAEVQAIAAKHRAGRRVSECFEVILGGQSAELRSHLAEVLAVAVRGNPTGQEETP